MFYCQPLWLPSWANVERIRMKLTFCVFLKPPTDRPLQKNALVYHVSNTERSNWGIVLYMLLDTSDKKSPSSPWPGANTYLRRTKCTIIKVRLRRERRGALTKIAINKVLGSTLLGSPRSSLLHLLSFSCQVQFIRRICFFSHLLPIL